jgi:hypothetical protein
MFYSLVESNRIIAAGTVAAPTITSTIKPIRIPLNALVEVKPLPLFLF